MVLLGHSQDALCVSWDPVQPSSLVTAGGSLHLYDAAARRHVSKVRAGFSATAVGHTPDGQAVVAGGQKGALCAFDAKTLEVLPGCDAIAAAGKHDVSCVVVSPDGSTLAVGCGQEVLLYLVRSGYKLLHRCEGHSGSVLHLDWSTDGGLLRSTDSAYEILFWDPATGKRATGDYRDEPWASFTSPLGFPVMGIWEKGAVDNQVNGVSRSHAGDLVATVDDESVVKLFNYPCVVDGAPFHAYRGHCSHAMCVRFSPDDRFVVSAGGDDRAVFSFRVQ